MINKVLFVTEKWCAGKPEFGPTNCETMLVETLQDTGFVENILKFHYDEIAIQAGWPMMGEFLIETCGRERPDLIIFTPMGLQGIDPSRSTMDIITNRLGIKVLMIRFDSIGEEGHKFQMSWFPFVTTISFFDAALSHLECGNNPKAIQGFSSFNPRYFRNKGHRRDIDVCFVGGIPGFPRREEYIDYLKKNGVNIITRGGQRFDRLSWREYAEIIGRSNISLNFCLNGCGLSQFKGRVFESLACKTFLLEDEGIETIEFFEEGRDFVMVHSKEEMLEKVRYYLEHDQEREEVAFNGYKKAHGIYNPGNMWAYHLRKMGLSVEDNWRTRFYPRLCKKMGLLSKKENHG